MVKLGKMMWNEIVKATCSRARRTGSKAIAAILKRRNRPTGAYQAHVGTLLNLQVAQCSRVRRTAQHHTLPSTGNGGYCAQTLRPDGANRQRPADLPRRVGRAAE